MTDQHRPDTAVRDSKGRDGEPQNEERDVETRGTDIRNVNARTAEPDASPAHANDAQTDGAHADDAQPEQPKRRSKIFDPDVKFVDPSNYLNRIYDAPDEEWSTWRMSADGKTRYRF